VLGGGSGSKLEGALYFPSVRVEVANGSMLSAAYTLVVWRNNCGSRKSVYGYERYSSLSNGSPIKKTVLFE
jgi:hypothetical protein